MKLIIRRIHAAVMALSLLFISPFGSSPAFAKGETIIRFPDRPIGRFNLIRPASDPTDDGVLSRDNLAVGAIKVPAGCMLSLTLNFNGSQNTKFIRQLPSHLIRSITCKDLEIDDKSVSDICTMTDMVNLNLQGTDLTDEGIKALSPLTKLRRLNICDTLVTQKGLAVLKNMPFLDNLNLSRLTLGDGVVEQLKPLSNLQQLDLCGTQLKEKSLLQLPRFDKLLTLNIGRNNVSDKCLVSLLKYKNLHALDVMDTWITGEGLKKLKGLPKLRIIVIRDASLKNGEKEQLRKLFPLVKINDGSRERVIPKELFAPLH